MTDDDPGKQVHLFSAEAFNIAKAMVNGELSESDASAKADEMMERFAGMADLGKTAPEENHAELNQVLSEAQLDLMYVQTAGNLPSSLRLGHYLRERAAAGD